MAAAVGMEVQVAWVLEAAAQAVCMTQSCNLACLAAAEAAALAPLVALVAA